MISLSNIFLLEESENEENDGEDQPLEEFALLIDPGRHSTDFILYKPKYYAQKIKYEINKAKNKFDKIKFKGDQFDTFKDFYGFSNIQNIVRDPAGIYGFMSINNGRIMGINGTCNRANEVRVITTKPGFGKLMFNIVLARESIIMPNRNQVSKNSYEQWNDLNINPSLEIDKFNDEMGLHKKTSSDCSVYGDKILDQSYKTKTDLGYQIQPLINRHKMFINQMKNFFKKNQIDYIESRVKEYIADAGNLFYIEKRGDENWYEAVDLDY